MPLATTLSKLTRAALALEDRFSPGVVNRFPTFGFARIRCDDCGTTRLLAFSCKGRYFCSSCHAKKVQLFGEFVRNEVAEAVPHRHWVFSVPKMLRPYFKFDRALLKDLCRIARGCLVEGDARGRRHSRSPPGGPSGMLFPRWVRFRRGWWSPRRVARVGCARATRSAPAWRGSVTNCFAFSIHKAGSTLFYKLLSRAMDMARRYRVANALRYQSVPDRLFKTGIPEIVLLEPDFPTTHRISFADPDTLYGGFRFVPGFASDEFLSGYRVMTLVRDPRDTLTSLYYSVAGSHVIPPGEEGQRMLAWRAQVQAMGIDDFVRQEASKPTRQQFFSRLAQVRHLGKAWRYEDVVFDKGRWLDEILAYLEVDLPRLARREIVTAEEIRPAAEDPARHVRQVTPGDHRRKLIPETIAVLDDIFGNVLDDWGYR